MKLEQSLLSGSNLRLEVFLCKSNVLFFTQSPSKILRMYTPVLPHYHLFEACSLHLWKAQHFVRCRQISPKVHSVFSLACLMKKMKAGFNYLVLLSVTVLNATYAQLQFFVVQKKSILRDCFIKNKGV